MARTVHHPTKIPKINLLPKDPFYETPIGKSMVWALRVGRYIIVFTEIIVIVSFASRFKLDRDLTDLNQSINQKTAIVTTFADTEARIRAIQQQSTLVSTLLTQAVSVNRIQLFLQNVPNRVRLTRISYAPGEIQASGIAADTSSFTLFLSTVQKVSVFKTISVSRLSEGDIHDPGWKFDMTINFGDKPPALPQSQSALGSTTGGIQ